MPYYSPWTSFVWKFCFLFLGALIFFPEISFAKNPYLENITQILSLWHQIDQEKRMDIKNSLQEKRIELMSETLRIQGTLKARLTEKPTLDMTRKYRLFLQKYNLSCEIAALRIVLETISKKTITEDEIFSNLPTFPGEKQGDIWGDPDRYFVWDIRGKQSNFTGFWVYAPPLQDFLKTKWINSWIYGSFDGRNISPSERLTTILSSLQSWYHVILWGDYCTLPTFEDGIIPYTDTYVSKFLGIASVNRCKQTPEKRRLVWKTPEGGDIIALSGEHAFVLLGYFWDITDPTDIIVWDTKTGKHIYKIDEWMRKWKLLDYRSLIVEP